MSISNTSVSASLAQWLEHWSCKPGVESSNLSRGCYVFSFCPNWCTNNILIYLFIHRLVAKWFSFIYLFVLFSFSSPSSTVHSFIQPETRFIFLVKLSLFTVCFLFASLFFGLVYVEHQCISLISFFWIYLFIHSPFVSQSGRLFFDSFSQKLVLSS